MLQAKISAFFKPSGVKNPDPPVLSCTLEASAFLEKEEKFLVTYKRRYPENQPKREDYKLSKQDVMGNDELVESGRDNISHEAQMDCLDSKSNEKEFRSTISANSSVKLASTSRVLNKRNYVQYHLELGQSDFLLHTCSVCGIKYARGDEEDEKLHKTFHKNYHQGIHFKGWRNERVVSVPPSNGDRVVLILDGDPPAHRDKVQEVIKMMERDLDLNSGWLVHSMCKVYLFISGQRVIGCLVTEPIRAAHRVISSSDNEHQLSSAACRRTDRPISKTMKSNLVILEFGDVNFQREITKKHHSTTSSPVMIEKDLNGTVLCEVEAVPALCGIRAIWVVPSKRRRRVATHLLDALRKSFCMGYVLEPSQCAFSHPTSAGKAFAISYSGTESYLVYKAEYHQETSKDEEHDSESDDEKTGSELAMDQGDNQNSIDQVMIRLQKVRLKAQWPRFRINQ